MRHTKQFKQEIIGQTSFYLKKKIYLPEVPQPYGKNIHKITAKCG